MSLARWVAAALRLLEALAPRPTEHPRSPEIEQRAGTFAGGP